jgi:CRP-like cAMP-binding protein
MRPSWPFTMALLAIFLGLSWAAVGYLGSTASWDISLFSLIPLFALQVKRLRKSNCSKRCCPQIFSSLTDKDSDRLMELWIPVRYERGDLIFQEGEYASGIHIVCRGVVRLGKYYRGKRLTLELLRAREILGMEALANEGSTTRPAYAQAVEDTEVAFIEKKAFLAFLQEYPDIISGLYQRALEKIVFLQRKLVQSALACAEERLAGILLELGESCGTVTKAGVFINVHFARSDLAELVGVSQETLIRSLSKLRHEGLIELHDHKGITIRDPERLEEMTLMETALA